MALHRHTYEYWTITSDTYPVAGVSLDKCPNGHDLCLFGTINIIKTGAEVPMITAWSENIVGHTHSVIVSQAIGDTRDAALVGVRCPLGHDGCRRDPNMYIDMAMSVEMVPIQSSVGIGTPSSHRHTYNRCIRAASGWSTFGACAGGHANCRLTGKTAQNPWCFAGNRTIYTGYPQFLEGPSVTTDPATEIGVSRAKLNGNLTKLGGVTACLCGFEWGFSTSYGNITPVVEKTSVGTFSQVISNLKPDTVYHFRAFASYEVLGETYTVYGTDMSFITRATGALPSSRRAIITLEALRNIEMMRQGRFYIDEQGKAVWESRFHRSA